MVDLKSDVQIDSTINDFKQLIATLTHEVF